MDRGELLERSRALAQRQAQVLEGPEGPLQLQPGEDPDTTYAADAVHWIAVYSELVGFKHDLIRQIRESLSEAEEPNSRRELLRDQEAAQFELERMMLHLEYWTARAQLDADLQE